MRTRRWLVNGTVVLDPSTSDDVLTAVEDALTGEDVHVFRGLDVAQARTKRQLTFAVIVVAAPDSDAVNDAVLEVHRLVTAAGALVLRIDDRSSQRLA